jgi:hypothetical protein
MGGQEFARSSQKLIEVALQVLDGLDPRKIPRYADQMDPLDAAGEQIQLDAEETVAKRQAEWLKAHGLR